MYILEARITFKLDFNRLERVIIMHTSSDDDAFV